MVLLQTVETQMNTTEGGISPETALFTKTKIILEKELQYVDEIIACGLSMYTLDHPNLTLKAPSKKCI